jgi:CRP-like cAMP-binding protein
MHEVDNAAENAEILRLFTGIQRFALLPEDELRTFIGSGRLRVYEPGEVLIREGEYDCWVYFLISGHLEVTKSGKPVGQLQRNGDMFGEMGIIDGSPRSATIRAAARTVTLGLDASCIDQRQKDSDLSFCYLLYRLFAEVLAARLRDTTDETIRLRDAIARIGHIDY